MLVAAFAYAGGRQRLHHTSGTAHGEIVGNATIRQMQVFGLISVEVPLGAQRLVAHALERAVAEGRRSLAPTGQVGCVGGDGKDIDPITALRNAVRSKRFQLCWG